MPILHPAVRRSGPALVLLAGLTGCSLVAPGQPAASPSGSSASPSAAATSSADPGAAAGGTVSTEEETCARVVEAARTAPQQLGEDPLALLQELTALADTAPAELAVQIDEVRDAVDGFRQGERRLTEVVGEVRELQQRCSA